MPCAARTTTPCPTVGLQVAQTPAWTQGRLAGLLQDQVRKEKPPGIGGTGLVLPPNSSVPTNHPASAVPSGPTPAGLGDDVTGARWPPPRVPVRHTWTLTLQRPHPLSHPQAQRLSTGISGGPAHTTWGVQTPGVCAQLSWAQQHLAAQEPGWKRGVQFTARSTGSARHEGTSKRR